MVAIVRFQTGNSGDVEPDPAILGGKGANLVEMCRLGLPIPPGFIITTPYARKYREKERITKGLRKSVKEALDWLQAVSGKEIGSMRRPLLLAVRSGAPASMPGMMDTILNIGLNEETVEGLARFSGNPRFAWDSYRRLITTYGDIVLEAPRAALEEVIREFRAEQRVEEGEELDAESLQRLTGLLRKTILELTSIEFPQDPQVQLFNAIEAVLSSWNSARAIAYRRMGGIEDTGTAVTVQAMVFGNSGGNSGSGVAFSRDPSTGEDRFYMEFLSNAQGEDIVSGARVPDAGDTLEAIDPELFQRLRKTSRDLEFHFRDMQDIEFTVEDGKLHLLQTRTAKRSPVAALRVAVEMVEEGLIEKQEAIARLAGLNPTRLERRRLAPPPGVSPIARGIGASAGVAVGKVALTTAAAVDMRERGENVILVREETQAADLPGMGASVGLLTARGGRTSHAAVVARQLGLTCVVGCEPLTFHGEEVLLDNMNLRNGQAISLDGSEGLVYGVELPIQSEAPLPELSRIHAWSEELGLPRPF